MKDDIGNRFKNNYEKPYRHYLTRRTPVIIRVDGQAFHTYTRYRDKPFDADLRKVMVYAAQAVAKRMQGCKMAYIQSDEVSFVLTDYDTLQTQPWFGNCQNKMESSAAALMTAYFNQYNYGNLNSMLLGPATFDARAFNVPEDEVVNYFVWRAKDWHRNSVQMLARSVFSHEQLIGANIEVQKEMLRKEGQPWSDLARVWRYGTFLLAPQWDVWTAQPYYKDINQLWSFVDPQRRV